MEFTLELLRFVITLGAALAGGFYLGRVSSREDWTRALLAEREALIAVRRAEEMRKVLEQARDARPNGKPFVEGSMG